MEKCGICVRRGEWESSRVSILKVSELSPEAKKKAKPSENRDGWRGETENGKKFREMERGSKGCQQSAGRRGRHGQRDSCQMYPALACKLDSHTLIPPLQI